jgi:molybdopterin/thiamine biosynthesis adenylyltransferase
MSTTDPQQQQLIQEAMKSIAERRPGRSKLVYDKTRRTIVAVAAGADSPRALNITADDADMFAVITLSSRWMRDHWGELQEIGWAQVSLSNWDDGDAWTHSALGVHPASILGNAAVMLKDRSVPSEHAMLIVVSPTLGAEVDSATFVAPDGSYHRAECWRRVGDSNESIPVCFADVQPELATRRSGILESTVLQNRTVLIIGLGTGGAHAAIELAKCGVGSFTLIDDDRLSVGNVVRHPGGISEVGRYKVNVVRDCILEKNPDARVATHCTRVDMARSDVLSNLISQADVVICGTDNRPSKLLVNALCVGSGKVALYGGAFRRAYGGQVLRVRPKLSPCQQCFIAAMPEQAADTEIASAADANAVAYSDRAVPIEPGLSLDVLPIANMLAKLALLELLIGKHSSLDILTRDFEAPWYLWLNRPEPGTQYATWPPLSESSDEMTIHRWYGIYFDRDRDCPVCGAFLASLAAKHGIDLATVGAHSSLQSGES